MSEVASSVLISSEGLLPGTSVAAVSGIGATTSVEGASLQVTPVLIYVYVAGIGSVAGTASGTTLESTGMASIMTLNFVFLDVTQITGKRSYSLFWMCHLNSNVELPNNRGIGY